jgi:putative iron-regulated protein
MFSTKRILVFIFCALFVLSCGGGGDDSDGGGDGGGTNDELIQTVINDYVDQVVIPTYELLSERTTALRVAVEVLRDDPTQENLEAARDAWFDARVPWEQSESWLFGPVDFKGHDPALDTWPVNRTDLDAVLESGNDLTEDFVANLDPSLKGFHTAEYLLFAFDIEELGDREFDYLVSVVGDIETTAAELYTDWVGGVEPFGDVMKGAGSNSVFPSEESAVEQIIEGMSIILDEVANGKIAEPYDNQDVEAVESQFSFNSRQDFTDDIRGVLNSYTGDQPDLGLVGTGINDLVAESDPELAQRLEDEINAAIAAILAIPQPFRDAILDPDAADEIEAAQEACRQAFDTLNEEVLPIIQ